MANNTAIYVLGGIAALGIAAVVFKDRISGILGGGMGGGGMPTTPIPPMAAPPSDTGNLMPSGAIDPNLNRIPSGVPEVDTSMPCEPDSLKCENHANQWCCHNSGMMGGCAGTENGARKRSCQVIDGVNQGTLTSTGRPKKDKKPRDSHHSINISLGGIFGGGGDSYRREDDEDWRRSYYNDDDYRRYYGDYDREDVYVPYPVYSYPNYWYNNFPGYFGYYNYYGYDNQPRVNYNYYNYY